MTNRKIIIIGAGCPLANIIASTLSKDSEVIGISKKYFENPNYHKILIFDFFNEQISMEKLGLLTNNIDNFVVITCTGRFPRRKFMSDYSTYDDIEIYKSNVLGFVIPYRATINNARLGKSVAYITFGSVSQVYKYPKLSIYTAAKDALKALIITASHEESANNIKFIHLNLSTLEQEKESCFTSDSAGKFLPCEEVSLNIENLLKGLNYAPYFSEYYLYKHSDAYYEEGYYSRIPKEK